MRLNCHGGSRHGLVGLAVHLAISAEDSVLGLNDTNAASSIAAVATTVAARGAVGDTVVGVVVGVVVAARGVLLRLSARPGRQRQRGGAASATNGASPSGTGFACVKSKCKAYTYASPVTKGDSTGGCTSGTQLEAGGSCTVKCASGHVQKTGTISCAATATNGVTLPSGVDFACVEDGPTPSVKSKCKPNIVLRFCDCWANCGSLYDAFSWATCLWKADLSDRLAAARTAYSRDRCLQQPAAK